MNRGENTPGSGALFGPVLVGLRGSGKTTLAPLVAERIGLVALDADAELEQQIGCPVSFLLRQEGEEAFRQQEQTLLLDLLSRPCVVLATGGGAVLHPPVRSLLRHRCTIWLDADDHVLVKRIAATGASRPSLTGLSADKEVAALRTRRANLYQEVAYLRLDTGRHDTNTLVEQIANTWRERWTHGC